MIDPRTSRPVPVAGEDSEAARAQAAGALRRARRVILSSHEKVDADGAGSALGLARGLGALGIDARAAFPSPLPENLRFLPGAAAAVVVADAIPEDLRGAEAFVALDCGAASRLGALRPAAEAAAIFLNVDHHASNDGFGTHRWVDASYAATGVMAFELLCELGVQPDREMCLSLYTALVFDSGGFAFSNTDARSHRMAAGCIERGVRPEEVTAALHRSRSLASWRLEAEAIARLRTEDAGTIAWTGLPEGLLPRHGLREEGLPDLVQIPTSLAPTRLAFLLTELEGGAGVRVSLRSRCPVGVHEIAARHGGGCHARAAGMTLPGTLEGAQRTMLEECRCALADWCGKRRVPGPPPQDA